LVTASDDTTARVWEIADRRLSDRFGWDDGMLETVRFSRDDRRIIAEGTSGQESPGSLLIWDALTGELQHNAPFRDNRSSLVGFNSSGTLAILREGGDDESGTARVWDIPNRREVAKLGDRTIGVGSALFSPDDRVVAIVEHDGTIRVWDANDGRQISEAASATGDFPVLCFSPDSRSLLIGPKAPEGKERAAVMVEVATGKVLFEMPLGIYDVMSASFHPAGTMVATGSNDAMARIWEMPSGKLLETLPKHPQTVECVEFSPDGTMLATACWRSTVVQVWRVGSWQRICRIQNPSYQLVEQVAFSPDSRLLAGASDRESTLRIWEARSGQCIACFGFPHAELRDLAFSHDGTRLVIPCRNSGATPESGGPLVLEVPALIPPVPGWFADFLRCLLQRKIGDDGQQRVLTPAEWEELRDRVTTVADQDRTRYGELARWFLAPASSRPLRPGAAMTRHELADRLVTPEAGPVQLARALAFDPANALAHLAMARFAQDDAARKFLQTWARQRLPELPAPELQRRMDALRALPAVPPAPPDE
jgi:WD40 repeat protein